MEVDFNASAHAPIVIHKNRNHEDYDMRESMALSLDEAKELLQILPGKISDAITERQKLLAGRIAELQEEIEQLQEKL